MLSPKKRDAWATVVAWSSEIVWSLISVLCLVGISVIFDRIDRKPQPQQILGISANAIIAFLATFCRVAFMIPIVEGASQLKWNWYARDQARPLPHLQAVDMATRGAWGCIKLLVTLWNSKLAVILSLVTITGFLTSAMTQAAISIGPLRQSSDLSTNDAFAPASGSLIHSMISSNIMPAVQQRILTPARSRVTPVPPIYKTGFCNFPEINTLGVCFVVHNVTDKLQISKARKGKNSTGGIKEVLGLHIPSEDWLGRPTEFNTDERGTLMNATLPNGASLVGLPGHLVLNVSSLPNQVSHVSENEAHMLPLAGNNSTLTFQDYQVSGLMAFTMIWINHGYIPIYMNDLQAPVDSFRAVEVLFHICTKTYDVSVRTGVTNTTLVATNFEGQQNGNVTTFEPASGSVSMDVENPMMLEHYNSLRRTLYGTYGFADELQSSQTMFSGVMGRAMIPGLADAQPDYRSPHEDDVYSHQAILNMTQNIADSLTNKRYGNQITRQRWGRRDSLLRGLHLRLVAVAHAPTCLEVDVVKSQLLPALFAIETPIDIVQSRREADKDVAEVYRKAPRLAGRLKKIDGGWELPPPYMYTRPGDRLRSVGTGFGLTGGSNSTIGVPPKQWIV
ncbi:Carboxylic ester hydrolase [Fusarium albosuccineum]|uniref:Carboxylic ester hydrolase n=1 Tax=Fusarium albosuccineum TaxID=1237068 RepID=A0A8H4LBI7_9HYPO|nr:Carboxylic ester hydrolase [Fusarium albosuccineum]